MARATFHVLRTPSETEASWRQAAVGTNLQSAGMNRLRMTSGRYSVRLGQGRDLPIKLDGHEATFSDGWVPTHLCNAFDPLYVLEVGHEDGRRVVWFLSDAMECVGHDDPAQLVPPYSVHLREGAARLQSHLWQGILGTGEASFDAPVQDFLKLSAETRRRIIEFCKPSLPARNIASGSSSDRLESMERERPNQLVTSDPIPVSSASECDWYHRFDFPDGSSTRGPWDYRHNVDDYLGRIDYKGKSVIEIGPASGFLTVAMEQRGARVTSIDNPVDGQVWEFVPRVDMDVDAWLRARRPHQLRVNKSWWFAQKAFGCSAKVAYCGVAGLRGLVDRLKFDVCFIGGVLQHVRYPMDVLWIASRIANEVVVSERFLSGVEADERPFARFVPAPDNDFLDTWWYLSSNAITNAMSIFGFERAQKYRFDCRMWGRPAGQAEPEKYRDLEYYSAHFRRRH